MNRKQENTPRLETERLILRRFEESDVDALYAILSDEEVNRFLPMVPLRSREEAEAYLWKSYLQEYEKPYGYQYAICLKEDNVPIGYVHMSEDESHDFGYGLRKEFWRQGIVSEAAKAVTERISKSGIPFITATHDVNNPGSGGVMRKIGMKYCYTYEELWQPKNFLVRFRMYQMNFDGQQDRVYRKYWEMFPNHYVEDLE